MSKELRDILVKVVHEEYVDQAEQAILALMDKRFEECLPEKWTGCKECIERGDRSRYGCDSCEGSLETEFKINKTIDEIRARWERGKV